MYDIMLQFGILYIIVLMFFKINSNNMVLIKKDQLHRMIMEVEQGKLTCILSDHG